MTDLEHILRTLEYDEEDMKKVVNSVGTIRKLLTVKRETLERELGGVTADEICEVKKWYIEFRNSKSSLSVKQAFTLENWDGWVLRNSSDEGSVKSTMDPMKRITKEFDGLNISYKVESKEIPRLPAGKSLKGKIFDDWHTNFVAKMSQARIDEILEENFMRPDENDAEYPDFKIKMDYLKNHLLTATINSNASSFIKPKTMDGIEMYQKLVNIFQGQNTTKTEQ